MKFKIGDKVKCSSFLYRKDNRYIGMVGTFIKYNKLDTFISYVNFRNSFEDKEVSCFTSSIVSKATKNQQLLFSFMD